MRKRSAAEKKLARAKNCERVREWRDRVRDSGGAVLKTAISPAANAALTVRIAQSGSLRAAVEQALIGDAWSDEEKDGFHDWRPYGYNYYQCIRCNLVSKVIPADKRCKPESA